MAAGKCLRKEKKKIQDISKQAKTSHKTSKHTSQTQAKQANTNKFPKQANNKPKSIQKKECFAGSQVLECRDDLFAVMRVFCDTGTARPRRRAPRAPLPARQQARDVEAASRPRKTAPGPGRVSAEPHDREQRFGSPMLLCEVLAGLAHRCLGLAGSLGGAASGQRRPPAEAEELDG